MYDLAKDPLEMKNLAHPSQRTPESDVERARLHRRLSGVMAMNGTIPDEIRWPAVDDYQPVNGSHNDANEKKASHGRDIRW